MCAPSGRWCGCGPGRYAMQASRAGVPAARGAMLGCRLAVLCRARCWRPQAQGARLPGRQHARGVVATPALLPSPRCRRCLPRAGDPAGALRDLRRSIALSQQLGEGSGDADTFGEMGDILTGGTRPAPAPAPVCRSPGRLAPAGGGLAAHSGPRCATRMLTAAACPPAFLPRACPLAHPCRAACARLRLCVPAAVQSWAIWRRRASTTTSASPPYRQRGCSRWAAPGMPERERDAGEAWRALAV